MRRNGVEEDAMTSTYTTLDQGTTLAWTQAYGSTPGPVRAREGVRDTLFALALLGLVAGVAGFVTMETPGASPTAAVRVAL
jgi:hypothetical protein